MARFNLIPLLVTAAALMTVAPVAADIIPPGCNTNALDLSVARNPSVAHNGDTIAYTITVFNGDFPACQVTEVKVWFYPPGTDGQPDTAAGILLDSGATFNPGDMVTYPSVDVVLAVDQGVSYASAMVTCAGELQDATPPGYVVDTKTLDVWVLDPCIAVTKTADVSAPKVGDTVNYEICVINWGNADLYEMTVVDSLLGDLSHSFADWIPAGAPVECHTFPYTVQSGDPDPLVNSVTVTGTDVLGLTVTASATTGENQLPTCSITAAWPLSVVGCTLALDCRPSDPDGTVVVVRWDFGDGRAAMGNPVMHTYYAADTYAVTVTVIDNDGGFAICSLNLHVDEAPECVLPDTTPPVIVCPPDITTCCDPGTATATVDCDELYRVWSACDNCDVVVVWNDAPCDVPGGFPIGTTVVTWGASDAAGNCSSCEQLVTVEACGGPMCDITYTPASPTTDDTITFHANAVDPDGTVVAVEWDFDDGASASGDWVAHRYVTAGTYVVTVTVRDDGGASGTCALSVDVAAGPGCILPDIVPPVILCPPDITTCTDPGATAATVDCGELEGNGWDYYDNCGVVAVWHDAPCDVPGGFPIGTTAVTWTACDDAGNTSSCTQNVTVEVCGGPTCDITYTPASPTTEDLITFHSGATDPDGTIVSIDWAFGDGGTASGDPATHQYAIPETYTVTVTVCDNDGLCTDCAVDVTVGEAVNIPPTAAFDYTPGKPTTLEMISFKDQSTDADGAIVAWAWDFGDGATSNEQHPVHQYPDPGTYTVALLVTDDDGLTGSATQDIIVTIMWGVIFAHPWDDKPSYPGPEPLANQIAHIHDLHVPAAKPWIIWNRVQARVNVLDGIGLTSLFLNPEATEELIDKFASAEPSDDDPNGVYVDPLGYVDWREYDRIIGALTADGIRPVPNIADGGTTHTPQLSIGTFAHLPTHLSPGNTVLEYDYYLGHVFLFVAAAARRYSPINLNAPGVVTLWNTENELNVAPLAPALGWRAHCRGWKDPGFLYGLMEVLWAAVHVGNPEARNTMNISAFDPFWRTTTALWLPFMDVVGLSVYPNYLGVSRIPPVERYAGRYAPLLRWLRWAHFSDEVAAAEWLRDQVSMAVAFAGSKPVMVMETGLKSGPDWAEPFRPVPVAFPTGLTRDGQATYLRLAACAAVSAGADGFFWHKLYDSSYDDYPWQEREWGLLTYGGTPEPKLAFDAYHDIITDYAATCAGP